MTVNEMTKNEMFRNVISGEWETAGDDTQFRFDGDVLYLQASSGKEDWKNNFCFLPQKCEDLDGIWFVHKGFLKCFNESKAEILPRLLEIEHPIIIGYSHGGPLSALFGKAFKDASGRTCEVHTFGSPRFLAWYKSWKVKDKFNFVTNYQTNIDIVTHLPPAIFGFVHIGKRVRLGAKSWWTCHAQPCYLGSTSWDAKEGKCVD